VIVPISPTTREMSNRVILSTSVAVISSRKGCQAFSSCMNFPSSLCLLPASSLGSISTLATQQENSSIDLI